MGWEGCDGVEGEEQAREVVGGACGSVAWRGRLFRAHNTTAAKTTRIKIVQPPASKTDLEADNTAKSYNKMRW